MSPLNWHAISTQAWVIVIALVIGATAGFTAGLILGLKNSPSYHDALRVEHRLREVFCEQAVRNGLLKTCEVMK